MGLLVLVPSKITHGHARRKNENRFAPRSDVLPTGVGADTSSRIGTAARAPSGRRESGAQAKRASSSVEDHALSVHLPESASGFTNQMRRHSSRHDSLRNSRNPGSRTQNRPAPHSIGEREHVADTTEHRRVDPHRHRLARDGSSQWQIRPRRQRPVRRSRRPQWRRRHRLAPPTAKTMQQRSAPPPRSQLAYSWDAPSGFVDAMPCHLPTEHCRRITPAISRDHQALDARCCRATGACPAKRARVAAARAESAASHRKTRGSRRLASHFGLGEPRARKDVAPPSRQRYFASAQASRADQIGR